MPRHGKSLRAPRQLHGYRRYFTANVREYGRLATLDPPIRQTLSDICRQTHLERQTLGILAVDAGREVMLLTHKNQAGPATKFSSITQLLRKI